MSKNKLLTVNNLHSYFYTGVGIVRAVNGVSFSIERGKTLGVVGESGSGKSITAMSVLRILEHPGKIISGSIRFDGKEITKLTEKQMRSIRGNDISMIFQEPMNSLNPVLTIGFQLCEPLKLHQKLSGSKAWKRAVEMLREVKIPNPERIAKSYPFQLSGGMRQRVMIAMALACEPKLLIADEPTTALDVTIQAQIFKLMNELKQKFKTSILFITHDLGAIAELADDVIVMYTGEVIERASVETIFNQNSEYGHPYTEGLLNSIPKITEKVEKLDQIEGNVPHPLKLPKGCNFAPRCKYAKDRCKNEKPKLVDVDFGHSVRCFYPEKRDR